MSKPRSLAVAFLLVAGAALAPVVARTCETPIASASAETVLSQDRSSGRIEIPSSVLAQPASFLEVHITHIVNPSNIPFSVYVFAIPRESGSPLPDGTNRVLLGNFSVYPPDQPGTFLVRVSEGLQRLLALKAGSARPNQFVTLLGIKPISGTAFSAPVEVTIAPLRWRRRLGPNSPD